MWITREDLKETLEYVSGYSLYAYEDELRQGYMSVQGGHRVGVTGKVILDGDRIRGMKYISCINVRLAHQIPGCADAVMPYIRKEKWTAHTLIISPPRCGKTTLLRDVIRQLSNGFGKIPGVTVGVVDERSELAGCYQGIPQNDLGMRTDVLDCCPKAQGMQMLIRAMSPAVVAVDELGKEEDFRAVEAVIHSGCRLIATAHGENVEAVLATPFFAELKKMRVFDRYIVLGKEKRAGIIRGIFDGRGVSILKFAGILMIFIAGTGMGTAKSMELTKRERNLKKFLWLTSCLKGTVRCGNSCFPEAFLEISEKFDGMYQEFLQSLADRLKGQEGQTLGQIFRDCAKKEFRTAGFSAEEMELIASLGDRLGYLDREMQLRQLDIFEEELCRRLDFLACQLPEKKKLCRNLGILGGIFLGVLLW